MKILTICIPCTHVTTSIQGLVESCMIQKDDLQILLVTDQITDLLQVDIDHLLNKYPETVCCVDASQEVMDYVTGLYFKIVSPDNTVDPSGLVKIVSTIRSIMQAQGCLDVLVCDYEYRTSKRKRDIISYKGLFPVDDYVEWHQTKVVLTNYSFVLESVIYKTCLVKYADLPALNTSVYMNDAFSIIPMSYVRNVVYLDTVLEKTNPIDNEVYFSEVDFGILVAKEVIKKTDISEIKSRKQKACILKQINLLFARVVVALLREGSISSLRKKEDLLYYLKTTNYILYLQVRKTMIGKLLRSENQNITKFLENFI